MYTIFQGKILHDFHRLLRILANREEIILGINFHGINLRTYKIHGKVSSSK